MEVQTVTLFFALLAAVATLIALAIGISAITSDRFGFIKALQPVAMIVATAIASTATAGSLYLSESANFEPCLLCWIQRAYMYPIVLVGALSLKYHRLALATLSLSLLGLAVAVFHRYQQATHSAGLCDPDNPCSAVLVDRFGFVTIPTMAGAGFAAIAALSAISVRAARS